MKHGEDTGGEPNTSDNSQLQRMNNPSKPTMLLAGDRNMVINQIISPNGSLIVVRTNDLLAWAENTLHKAAGNAALVDGSVQNLTSSRLRVVLHESGNACHRIVFP